MLEYEEKPEKIEYDEKQSEIQSPLKKKMKSPSKKISSDIIQ